MRRTIIAGNWKMNNTVAEAVDLANGLKDLVKDVDDKEIVLCPPFTALSPLCRCLAQSNLKVGAQDLYWEQKGAYTGEISPLMLKEIGCEYVIIGHSERRAYFAETNETVNKKAKAALSSGLKPIICVGEKLEEKEKGLTEEVVKDHLENGLQDIDSEEVLQAVIAYEPVWAIGTGKTATPGQAQEVHRFIRQLLKNIYGEDIARQIRIEYGGSVKPDNAADLLAQPDIDGALVGGASLDAQSFSEIVKS